jgi:DNA repair ATPase RecN
MSDLKKKYNQLFAGKPKSNDTELLSEGTYLFGIATGKKTIKEADETGNLTPGDFDPINRQMAEIYDMLYDLQEQLDNMTNDAFDATALNLYKDMNAQTSRYVKAIEQQLENLSNYLQRMQQRIGKI